jgi:hypothetical protein
MKLEFELNVMGILYILIAGGLITAIVVSIVDASSIANFSSFTTSPIAIVLFSVSILGGLIALGFLVPVVRRIFKAFMPSA